MRISHKMKVHRPIYTTLDGKFLFAIKRNKVPNITGLIGKIKTSEEIFDH